SRVGDDGLGVDGVELDVVLIGIAVVRENPENIASIPIERAETIVIAEDVDHVAVERRRSPPLGVGEAGASGSKEGKRRDQDKKKGTGTPNHTAKDSSAPRLETG